MDRALRVGVIGCGEIAQIAHLPYLQELPGLEPAAICDLSPKVLRAVGDRFGIDRRYQSYLELVAQPDLDAVLVSNRDHAAPALAAMQAGKHVLVEKPMAFNLDQADRMIAAARENGVKLMVAYMKRYDPGYEYALGLARGMKPPHLIRIHDLGGWYGINREIYDLVRGDDLPRGATEEAAAKERSDMTEGIGAERADLVEAFSLLMYNCSHDAIVLQEAFGPPRRIVQAELYANQFLVAVLDYGDNTRCVWESGLVPSLSDWDEHLAVYGDERRFVVKFPFPYLKNAATEVLVGEMEGSAWVDKRVVSSFDEAFKREWRHFYECIVHDREPITSGAKGRADIALLIDLLKAARP